ncbi:hypothetical protein STEG23_008199, partial [Scotinomys teguina]
LYTYSTKIYFSVIIRINSNPYKYSKWMERNRFTIEDGKSENLDGNENIQSSDAVKCIQSRYNPHLSTGLSPRPMNILNEEGKGFQKEYPEWKASTDLKDSKLVEVSPVTYGQDFSAEADLRMKIEDFQEYLDDNESIQSYNSVTCLQQSPSPYLSLELTQRPQNLLNEGEKETGLQTESGGNIDGNGNIQSPDSVKHLQLRQICHLLMGLIPRPMNIISGRGKESHKKYLPQKGSIAIEDFEANTKLERKEVETFKSVLLEDDHDMCDGSKNNQPLVATNRKKCTSNEVEDAIHSYGGAASSAAPAVSEASVVAATVAATVVAVATPVAAAAVVTAAAPAAAIANTLTAVAPGPAPDSFAVPVAAATAVSAAAVSTASGPAAAAAHMASVATAVAPPPATSSAAAPSTVAAAATVATHAAASPVVEAAAAAAAAVAAAAPPGTPAVVTAAVACAAPNPPDAPAATPTVAAATKRRLILQGKNVETKKQQPHVEEAEEHEGLFNYRSIIKEQVEKKRNIICASEVVEELRVKKEMIERRGQYNRQVTETQELKICQKTRDVELKQLHKEKEHAQMIEDHLQMLKLENTSLLATVKKQKEETEHLQRHLEDAQRDLAQSSNSSENDMKEPSKGPSDLKHSVKLSLGTQKKQNSGVEELAGIGKPFKKISHECEIRECGSHRDFGTCQFGRRTSVSMQQCSAQATTKPYSEFLRESHTTSPVNAMETKIRSLKSTLSRLKVSRALSELELERYKYLYHEETSIRKSFQYYLN